MKLALTINCWSDEDLLFASQFGVTHLLAEASIPQGLQWDRRTLASMRNRVEKAEFTFTGLAGLPQPFSISAYLQRGLNNDPGREQGLDALCAFVTEAGAAHIPLIVCECDMPGASESVIAPEGRAGALIHKYAHSTPADRAIIAGLWQHLTHWLQRVVPAAENAGVKLAFGSRYVTEGWLDSIGALQNLLDAVPCPCVGLVFNQGVIAQMPGVDLPEAIRHFGAQKKIFLVEVSNLRSRPAHVVEAFLDEMAQEAKPDSGAMLRVLQANRATGYEGPVQPVTPPGIGGDTHWGHKGQAFNLGYLRALLQVVERA
jgi:mannonate dehydratase